MKKQLAILSASILVAGGFVLPVSAHEGESNAIQVTAPAKDATVGSVFTVSVTINSETRCQLPNQIFLSKESDSPDGESHASFVVPSLPVFVQGSNNSYTYRVNTAEAYTADPIEGSVPQVPPAGRYDAVVASDDPECEYAFGHSEIFSIAYQTQPASAPRVKPSIAPQVAQKILSTPSPSVAPVMASDEPEVKGTDNGLDPAVALGLGALLGAALLSLAEVSALEYRKKHGSKAVKK